MLILTLLAGAASARDIPTPEEAAIVRTGLDQLYRMDYEAAEETFLGELPAQSPARAYFSGIACLNRFLDWGDTAALRRAESHWEILSPRREPAGVFAGTDADRLKLYRGLVGFQLSYAASLRGQNFRAAALAIPASRLLRDLRVPERSPEARATLMLYAYYRGRLLEKLPLIDAPAFDVPAFTAAAEASILREAFLGSLFWIHVDHGRLEAAQGIARDFLARYPENRLGRELRAAALFRGGRLSDARMEYEKLRKEYAAAAGTSQGLPLGYYRATGNLARVHAVLGERRDTEARLAEWDRAERLGLMPWLPAGLARDLKKL